MHSCSACSGLDCPLQRRASQLEGALKARACSFCWWSGGGTEDVHVLNSQKGSVTSMLHERARDSRCLQHSPQTLAMAYLAAGFVAVVQ